MTPAASLDPSWAMFALVGAGQIITWIMLARDGQRKATTRAGVDAAAKATDDAALKGLTTEFSRMAKAWEGLTQQFQKHLLEDTDRFARGEEIMKQLASTQAALARTAENQQQQITNIVMGSADSFEEIPEHPTRRRGRA